jgi:phosphohistidine phosphatase SixA
MNRRAWTGRLLLLSLLGAAGPEVHADEALWSLLKVGGHVILMRHALTTPGVGDPDGMVLGDCATQRNLSDEGRAHARQVGDAFRARAIPVAQVVSSPWCRCIETARIAFGQEPQRSPALGNLFGRGDPQGRQVAQMRALASRQPTGGNLVLVSHGSTITALTGISPAAGEMVVLKPQGDGRFAVAGRLAVPGR